MRGNRASFRFRDEKHALTPDQEGGSPQLLNSKGLHQVQAFHSPHVCRVAVFSIQTNVSLSRASDKPTLVSLFIDQA